MTKIKLCVIKEPRMVLKINSLSTGRIKDLKEYLFYKDEKELDSGDNVLTLNISSITEKLFLSKFILKTVISYIGKVHNASTRSRCI